MLKLEENPPILAPRFDSVAAMDGEWFVAHTKARFEKSFAFDLLERGIGYFLPMAQQVRMSGGRKRRVMTPLFPSYVFFCGSMEDRYAALATHRLCQVIPVREREREQFVTELLAVEKALQRNAAIDLYPFATVGQRCRVRSGPFMGIEGTVVRRDDRTLLVLNVSLLGRGAALEIDASLLEPAN